MGDIERLLDQLDRSWEGESWHGPAAMPLLTQLTPAQAAARPIPGAHSAWELALHMRTWHEIAARRLQGEDVEPTPEENFPAVPRPSSGAWQSALDALTASRARLRAVVAGLDPGALDRATPGARWSAHQLVHGVIQHDLYHAGQIALLAKATTARASEDLAAKRA